MNSVCFFLITVLNTSSALLLLNKTAHAFHRGTFRTYFTYMTCRKDVRNAQNWPWVREIPYNVVRRNI